MKNAKNILYLLCATMLCAPLLTACYDDDPQFSSEIVITPPSDKFNTKIHFISKLDDASIATDDNGYAALKTYFATTLNKRTGCWMGVIDRADVNYATSGMFNGSVKVALDSKHYSSFCLNKIASGSQFQGSMMLMNTYYTSTASYKVGDDCYVNGLTAPMFGTRTDESTTGGSPTVTTVKFNVHFRTARFATQEHLNTFAQDILPQLKKERINMLMVGTVKSNLAEALAAAVKSADPAFKVEIVEGTQTKDYAIFVLSEERFWGLKNATTESLGGGITAYTLNMMW